MPNFLLVGAAFGGTHEALRMLGQHPEIYASPITETNYFVAKDLGTEGVMDTALLTRPRLGADGQYRAADVAHLVTRGEYERCFQALDKPAAVRFGEASPAYLFYPQAARRIAEQNPHCKIVVLLRDPVERVLEHYTAFEQQGREHLSLEEALEQEERRLAEGWAFHWSYLNLSRYTAGLTRYLARFPLPQIHLVQAESLRRATPCPHAWRALLQFLEVNPDVPAPGQAAGPENAPAAPVSQRTRRSLADRLHGETEFYREVFSEAPFRKTALRRLAGGGSHGQYGGASPTSPKAAAGGGAVFQHLLFTSDLTREALYYRKVSHNHTAHPRMSNTGGMNFLKDEIISFDGFFNAFFESLAAERTGMPSIQLRLEFSGQFFVEVIRLAQGRAPQLIVSAQSERRHGDGPLILEADLSTDSPLGSRLAFHLTCLSKTGTFMGGSWWTTAKPRRPVQLDIIACTYKKREFIERTVRRVADYRRLNHDHYSITVVDNGSELPEDLFPYPNVQIVHQGNFGGAGGAARGIMEGLNAQGRTAPTHFLLMDDDIELEPDMVLRAMSWLRHIKADQCIGGGMLDLYRPTHLHELGCWIGRPKLLSVSACVAELELAPAGSLDRLGRVPEPTFNAWWFMAISRDAVEKNGLPLPCFIRGDDKEFGLRMLQKGIPTLPVPGLAVWHMPFYAKVSAWLYYYNSYNDLLIRSLRNPELTGEVLAGAVWDEIEHYLEKLEYDQAAMRVLGLEHFLLGPQWLLESDCEKRFQETMIASKEFAAEHRKDIEPTKFNTHYNPKSHFDMRWRRWIHNGHLPLKWRKPNYTKSGLPDKVIQIHDWGWTDVTYFDEIGVKHPLVPGIYVFRKRPEVYFDLLQRAREGLATLQREWPQRSAEFRAYETELTSQEFWRRHLGIAEAESEKEEDLLESQELSASGSHRTLVPALAGS